jgi:succinate dehydrogenase hydrophobic anchor subunit
MKRFIGKVRQTIKGVALASGSTVRLLWVGIILAVFVSFLASLLLTKPPDFWGTIFSTVLVPFLQEYIAVDVFLLLFVIFSLISGCYGLQEKKEEAQSQHELEKALASVAHISVAIEQFTKSTEDLNRAIEKLMQTQAGHSLHGRVPLPEPLAPQGQTWPCGHTNSLEARFCRTCGEAKPFASVFPPPISCSDGATAPSNQPAVG